MRDLDLLATFLEVYRSGSITAGAARTGFSQPSVSERLARLEAQLGAPLFERSQRGVVPTPAGDRLAAQITDPIDRLRSLNTTEPAPGGSVRIGGASDVIAARVVSALAPLTSGGIMLSFTLGLARELLSALREGDLDLVISSIRVPLRGVGYRGLVDEEFVLVGAPSLARTIDPERMQVDPAAALSHLPLVAYDHELSIVRRYWRSQFGRRPAKAPGVVLPDLRGVLAAVVAGAGVSALPRYLADPAVAAGSVEVLHHPDEPPINTLHLAVSATRPPSAATAQVIEALRERAREWDTL